ncbi:hypothetical protein [Mycobacterium sp. E1386]|uniref:hypothetical protein n=1 Tax=Mycobacterium sp. E1386 TaxID=1834126 RepID=UPI000A49E571|nr:hypothetical protein [Mycobacterium sp. E1386]
MADQDDRGAKQVAAEALCNLRKTTALPRPLQFLTGEAAQLRGRESAPRPWADL